MAEELFGWTREKLERFLRVERLVLSIGGPGVRVVGDTITINTDPANPNDRTVIDRKQVVSMEPSKVSPMPEGLLNYLTKDEILDLCAYVLSAGNPQAEQFKK